MWLLWAEVRKSERSKPEINRFTYVCTSLLQYVIIFTGHNGLVAAAYLAKNKIKTCVLEKRPQLGGAAVTEEIIPNFKFSRASYLLSLLRPQIHKDLQLKVPKYILHSKYEETQCQKSPVKIIYLV